MIRYTLLVYVLGIFLMGCGDKRLPWQEPPAVNPAGHTETPSPTDALTTQESPSQGGIAPSGTSDTQDSDPYQPDQTPPSARETELEPAPDGNQAPSNDGVGTTVSIVSFSEVQPIFAKHCAWCHSASTTPPDWQNYNAAKTFLDSEKEVNGEIQSGATILKNRIWTFFDKGGGIPMPFVDRFGITPQDRKLIVKWIEGGGAE